MVPEPSDVPPELRSLRRWVCWREEWREGAKKPTKIPIAPWKGTTMPINALDPANWTTLEEALRWAKKLGLGVGIVLGEVEPGRVLTGIDLDHIINEGGVVNPEAEEIVKKANSYVELSPSFRGIHILGWLEGPLPRPLIHEGSFNVEVYNNGRWLTFTGKRWRKAPLELEDLSLLIRELQLKYEKEPTGEFLKEDARLDCVKVFEAMGGNLGSLKWTGDQFQGPHPVHGSTTMKNFTLHPTKGWHCFRHHRGGGAYALAAMMAGLIKCEEVGERRLGEEVKKKIRNLLREKGLEVPDDEERRDNFSRAMEIVEQRIVELFLEEVSGEAYATIKYENGGFANLPIRGRSFDALLNTIFYEVEGKGLREEVRKDVRATLEAKAFKEGKRKELQLLAVVNEKEGKILVDLGSPSWDSFVEITSGSWRIINPPSPLAFKRTEFSALLSVEEGMVEPEECRRRLSLLIPPRVEEEFREDSNKFLLPYFCTLLLTHIPRPGLLFTGPKGSSKSTMQRVIVRTFTGGDVEKLGRNERDTAVKLENSPIICFDNVRNITPEVADLLCIAITGGIYTTRRLYTDAEVKTHKLDRKSILLNGISPNLFSYPDLTDRFVVIPLDSLAPEERKEEKVLLAGYDEVRPKILSAVFSSLARALPLLEDVRRELRERGIFPRMSDFTVWGEAVARGMGYKPFEWLGAYLRLIQQTEEALLDENPLAHAILKFVEVLKELEEKKPEKIQAFPSKGKGWWVGTPTQFLTELENVVGSELQKLWDEGFPQSVRSLGKRLKELAPVLREHGVVLMFRRNEASVKRERLIEIRLSPGHFGRLDVSPILTPLPKGPEERKGEEERGGVGGEGNSENVQNVHNVHNVFKHPLKNLDSLFQDISSKPELSTPRLNPPEEGLWLVRFGEDYPGGLVGSLPGEIPKGASRVLTGWEVGELRRKFGFVEARKLEGGEVLVVRTLRPVPPQTF
ncbi:MAG: hypothetical protein QW356_08535, partial [Candidatus Hadarchaeales archaeon]